MHTKCPACKALFRINTQQLRQAQGRARCGQCNTLFDAQNNIVLPRAGEILNDLEASPDSRSRAEKERFLSSHPLPAAQEEDIPLPKLIPESHKGTKRHPAADTQPRAEISNKPDISFNSQTNVSPGRGVVALGLSSIALVFLLSAQFLYFHRDQLSKQPLLANVLEHACDMIGCVIQPIRDISRIEVISRNVYSHPSVANALMITATFANVAPFPQPYPVMEVSLTDLQGKTIAARRFLPDEYLGNASESMALMKPGVPVDVDVEVLDPQNGAMAFEFAFFDRLG